MSEAFRVRIENWQSLAAAFEDCIDERHADEVSEEDVQTLRSTGVVEVQSQAAAETLSNAVEDCGAEGVSIEAVESPETTPSRTVRGRVVGPDGTVIGNVVVRVTERSSEDEIEMGEAVTDSSGEYSVSFQPTVANGEIVVEALAASDDDTVLATASSSEVTGDTVHLDLSIADLELALRGDADPALGDDVFRFLTVRPATAAQKRTTIRPLKWHSDADRSEFHTELRELQAAGDDATGLLDAATGFIDSASYVGDLSTLPHPLGDVLNALERRTSRDPPFELLPTEEADIRSILDSAIDHPLSDVVGSEAFEDAERRLLDSLLAVSVVPGLTDSEIRLSRGIQILEFLSDAARRDTPEPVEWDLLSTALERPIVLPSDIDSPVEWRARDNRETATGEQTSAQQRSAKTTPPEQDRSGRELRERVVRLEHARAELDHVESYLNQSQPAPAAVISALLDETRVAVDKLSFPASSSDDSDSDGRSQTAIQIDRLLNRTRRLLHESFDPDQAAAEATPGDPVRVTPSVDSDDEAVIEDEASTLSEMPDSDSPSRPDSPLSDLSADAVWNLTPALYGMLSERTQSVLTEAGLAPETDTDSVPIHDAIAHIVAAAEAATYQLYEAYVPSAVPMVPAGSQYVASVASAAHDDTSAASLLDAAEWHSYLDTILTDGIRFDKGSKPRITPLGIGDLRVVRQRLERYELGEIAHIENVMRSEHRNREFRRLRRTEEERRDVEEVEEETERDIQTTERFELQREAERAIEQERESDAGVTISASYGPTVEVDAEVSYSQQNSSRTASRVAKTYGKQVTERATTRVQNRIRTEHVKRILEETEETTEQGVDNSGSDGDHISGIYRWVDKVYANQVYNYGERLMYEFIVPEPASFYLATLGATDPEGTVLKKPLPPKELVRNTSNNFLSDEWSPGYTDLSPRHITAGNVGWYVTQYGVTDPPELPPRHRTIAKNLEHSPFGEEQRPDFSGEVMPIPSGYRPAKIRITTPPHRARSTDHVYHPDEKEVPNEDPNADELPSISQPFPLTIGVGGHLLTVPAGGSTTVPVGEIETSPDEAVIDISPTEGEAAESTTRGSIELPVTVVNASPDGYVIGLELLLERTSQRYLEWKVDTYRAIMEAYQRRLAAYEEQYSRLTAGDSDFGTNPRQNRDIERTELQRAVIRILRDREFDFDSVVGGGENTPPTIDVDAAREQGETIQFLEQAFEWQQMTYSYYPYYWAPQRRWSSLLERESSDPLYTEFLRAGAARVVVSVRPGYRDHVQYYLRSGVVFSGNGRPTITDSNYVPIDQDVRERQGESDKGIPEDPPWETTLPTSLVKLGQSDDLNPESNA